VYIRAASAPETCENDDVCGVGYCCAGGACADRKDLGSACETNIECMNALYCDGSVRQPKKTIGETCRAEEECMSGDCDFPTLCFSSCDEGRAHKRHNETRKRANNSDREPQGHKR